MKFLRSTVGMIVVAALALFLGVYGFGIYNDWRERNRTDWKRKYDDAQDSVKLYRETSKRDSIEYRNVIVPRYIHVRDSALRDTTTSERTKNVIRACDLVVSACDSIQKNLRGEIRSLATSNELLRKKPGPPRFTAYGTVLYDAIGLRPVVRVGQLAKVVGPLHLQLEAEYAVPSQLREGKGDGLRVLVGARINFNR